MMNAEDNLLLLQRIDADRQFLLLALQSNPDLLARADARVQAMLQPLAPVPPAPSFSRKEEVL